MKKNRFLIFQLSILGLILMFTYSCKKDESDKNNQLIIGQSYQGGYIAYLFVQGDPGYDPNVQHGIIAAPYDQSSSVIFGASNGILTSELIGSGASNTNILVSSGSSNAAALCDDLVINNYNDWFLPSKEELLRFYQNKTAIGGFSQEVYWSSSKSNSDRAWIVYFGSGQTNPDAWVGNPYHVRAARYF